MAIVESRSQVVEVFQEIIRKNPASTVWIAAGELNPCFYSMLAPQLVEGIANHNTRLQIVAGREILVTDEDYAKYCPEGRLTGEYWNAHPILKLAHDFWPAQGVRLYIRRCSRGRGHTHFICSDNEKAPFITEKRHFQLQDSAVLVARNANVGAALLRRRFRDLTKSSEVVLWDPSDPSSEDHLKFRSISQAARVLEDIAERGP